MEKLPQEKTDRACHYTYYYYTKQKPKSGIKRHKHTVQRPPKRKKSHFLKKNPQIACTLYFFAIPLHHQTRRDHILVKKQTWRGGRVVDCTGLENRRTERYRGFESLSLRKKSGTTKVVPDFVLQGYGKLVYQ